MANANTVCLGTIFPHDVDDSFFKAFLDASVKKKQQEAEVGILLRVMKTCGYDAKLLTSSALSIMLSAKFIAALRRFFHPTILAPPMAKRNDPPNTPKPVVSEVESMTQKRTDAGILTSDSERFAFFGVIWRILFGCGGAAPRHSRLRPLEKLRVVS
jgi:hypothetical protein